jgi:hypothetical protein
LQATQLPWQATLQQTPSVQKPVAQSAFFVQAAALERTPQLPATQGRPGAQSLSLAQLTAQAFVAALQPNGAHTVTEPALHVPAPSHVQTPFTALASHLPGAQIVPVGYWRQAPAPLHMPSRPHDVTSVAAQSSGLRGGAPFGTNEHTPGDCGLLHTMHVSPHALSQHTPSTQNPLAQSPAQPQAWPFALLPPMQVPGVAPSEGAGLTLPQPSAATTKKTASQARV